MQISDCQKLSSRSHALDEKTNVFMWGLFMPTTMKASVRLGPSYNENLVACKNTDFKELRTLFDIAQKLILEQSVEILNISTMVGHFTPYHDQVIKWAKAKGTRPLRFSLFWEKCMIIRKRMRSGTVHSKDVQQTNEYTE